eukprot:753290-Hanusia_phi.AAC.5
MRIDEAIKPAPSAPISFLPKSSLKRGGRAAASLAAPSLVMPFPRSDSDFMAKLLEAKRLTASIVAPSSPIALYDKLRCRRERVSASLFEKNSMPTGPRSLSARSRRERR